MAPSSSASPAGEDHVFADGPSIPNDLPGAGEGAVEAPAEPDPTPGDPTPPGGPRILKKYPNRRLYDTRQSSYITLADVKAMVLAAEIFEVRDAKTGEDLTRSILLQIILEEETGHMPMFSAPMLAQIIRFYGHSMQGMMGSYLEKNLQTFTDVQHRIAAQSKGLYDPALQTPEYWMGSYAEQSRRMFQQMQDQMAKQAGALFGAGFGVPPAKR